MRMLVLVIACLAFTTDAYGWDAAASIGWLAVGPSGSVYVLGGTDIYEGEVYRYTPDGTEQAHWNAGYGARAIAAGPNGDVYTYDGYGLRVQRWTSSGDPLPGWTCDGDGRFAGLAVGPLGDVYVWDHSSLKFSADGMPKTWRDPTRAARGVAVGSDGLVYMLQGSDAGGLAAFTAEGNNVWSFPFPYGDDGGPGRAYYASSITTSGPDLYVAYGTAPWDLTHAPR